MSCNNNTSPCCPEIPYPQISAESVPSLIENLVYALYGTINKSIVNGRVVWDIPCDPNNTAEVNGIPREEGEGLLCYMLRIFNQYINSGYAFRYIGNGTQTIFPISGSISSNPATYLVAIDGVVQDPQNYTISSQNLVMSTAVPSGSVIVIVSHSKS